ncbi:N-6 DNA methylase [Tissierella praeacuta]|nr:N-6 DNA methylase [Tissierella praeacuta]
MNLPNLWGILGGQLRLSAFCYLKLQVIAHNPIQALRKHLTFFRVTQYQILSSHSLTSFSANLHEIMEAFNIYASIERSYEGLLYMGISKYADEIYLSHENVPNDLMGYIFEELIRIFSEIYNETADDEYFTPREVIRLMVPLIFNEDVSELSEDGK